jgi:2-methylcitrate dehydratase PrpD
LSVERAVIERAAREVETLVRWAVGLSITEIPAAIHRRAVLVLFDDIAAAVASRDEPEVASARSALLRSSNGAGCSVWDGRGSRSDKWSAAAVNAIACSWAELDEGYRLAVCHAGLYAVPAAVAEAEADARVLRDLLLALVVSYEIAARFAVAWRFPPATLHPHGVFSPLGAAAAIGKLRGSDLPTFLAAIGASTTLSMGSPFSHALRGILIRNAWAAAGSWLGSRAVDLAEAGIGGSSSSAFDVYSRALSGVFQPGTLTEGLGSTWAIASGYHKIFACCQYGHSAVQACLTLRGRISLEDLDAIDDVDVATHELGLTIDNETPESTLAGKFSLQHIVATTLLNGAADHNAFRANMLHDPDLVRLRRKITLSRFLPELPPPQDRPARVTIHLSDGRSLTEECLSAPGGPDRPLSDETILLKIGSLTEEVYPDLAPTVRRLLAAVEPEFDSRVDVLLNGVLQPRRSDGIRLARGGRD